MFDSKAILWEKGGPLATVWIAANLSKCKSFRVKLTRRDYSRADIVEACSAVMTPTAELTLRLSSHLLLGIVHIHSKQTHYALQESEELVKRFKFLSQKLSTNLHEKIKPGAVTLPDPLDQSPPTFDLNFSNMDTLTLYVQLDVDGGAHLGGQLASPTSSVSSSPSFIADPRDISIVEHPEETSVLEDSLWDSMYFGDEDPALLADQRKTILPFSPLQDLSYQDREEDELLATPPNQRLNQSDQVLLYDPDSGSFECSDVSKGSDHDVSCTEGGRGWSEGVHREEGGDEGVGEDREHSLDEASPKEFEIPFLNTLKKKSKTTSTSPETEPREGGGEGEQLVPVEKKRKRRRRKIRVFDPQIEMSSSEMSDVMNDESFMTVGTPDYTKQFKKFAKAADLLSQPFSNTVCNHVLASQCRDFLPLTPEELAANQVPLFKLSSLSKEGSKHATPMVETQVRTTPTSTPLVVGGMLRQRRNIEMSAIREDNFNRLSQLETEVQRRDSVFALSSEDPLRSASHILISAGESGMVSSSKSSLQASALARTQYEGQSLHVGTLSPIQDVENEMDSLGGSSLEFNNSAQTSSPFIQSKPEAYTAYVAEVMGGRSEVDFRELLPAGATKKTASVAFSHILALASKYQFITVHQTEPYGPITLQRGEGF